MASQNLAQPSSGVGPRNVPTTRTRIKVLTAMDVASIKSIPTDEHEKQQRWHIKIVQEMIESEKSYIRHLTLLVEFFMKPILHLNLMSSKEFNIVFGQIESIVQVNEELLRQLNEAWGTLTIGRVFLEMAPFLKLYSSYANNFDGAVNIIQRLEKKNHNFFDFKCKQESRPEVGMSLNSLLIMPVQRIPRYKLLLDELVQHTPQSSCEYHIVKDAFKLVDSATYHLNECIREHENMQKMLSIQQNLIGGQPKIVQPGRQFIKEGYLMKVSRKGAKSHRRFFILFNDMIIYCKQNSASLGRVASLLCCCVVPIKHCSVESLFGGGGNQQGVLMKLTCSDETLLLYTDNVLDGEAWVTAIQAATHRYSEFRQTLRKESSAKRPLRRAALKRHKDDSLSRLSKRRRLEREPMPVSPFNVKTSLFPLQAAVWLHECILPCKQLALGASLRHTCIPMSKTIKDNNQQSIRNIDKENDSSTPNQDDSVIIVDYDDNEPHQFPFELDASTKIVDDKHTPFELDASTKNVDDKHGQGLVLTKNFSPQRFSAPCTASAKTTTNTKSFLSRCSLM